MHRRRRVRRLMKWGGAGLFALTAVAWTLSMFGGLYFRTFTKKQAGWSWSIDLARGAVSTGFVWYFPRPTEVSWEPFRAGFWSFWKMDWRVDSNVKYLRVPLWMPGLLFATTSSIAWRLDRRDRRRGHRCPFCGYDLAGLAPSSPCPECGKTAR